MNSFNNSTIDKLSQVSMKAQVLFWAIFLVGSLSSCLDGGGSGGGTTATPNVSTPTVSTPVVTPTPTVSTPSDTSGSTSGSSQAQVVVSPIPSPTPIPTGIPVTLTYYSMTKTTIPQGDWRPLTMTGSCATYLAKTYCWDDGLHTLVATSTYHYTYWGLMTNAVMSEGYSICFGGCLGDYLTTPYDISTDAISTNIQAESNDTGNTVSDVFSHGTEESASCTELNNVLTCPSFTIQL